MEHLSQCGLRPRKDRPAVPSVEVLQAVQALRASVGDLASSSIHTASDRYAAFAEAYESLHRLATKVVECGIEGSDPPVRDGFWKSLGV